MIENMEVDKLIFWNIFNRTQTVVTNDWIEFKDICIKYGHFEKYTCQTQRNLVGRKKGLTGVEREYERTIGVTFLSMIYTEKGSFYPPIKE